jgi:hypothetical protein
MSNKRVRYSDLLRSCGAHYGVKEAPGRGKGSERLWERVVDGRRETHTMTRHDGARTELGTGLIASMRRRFHLDPAHGVTDADFYRDL